MALMVPPRDLQIAQAIADAVERSGRHASLDQRPQAVPAHFLFAEYEHLQVAYPHFLFTVDPTKLASAAPLRELVRPLLPGNAGYVIFDQGRPLALASVSGTHGGRLHVTLTFGQFTTTTLKAFDAAALELAPDIQDIYWSVLQSSPLYLKALWLRRPDRSQAPEFIVPIDPAPPGLHAQRLYSPVAISSWARNELEQITQLRRRSTV